MEHEIWVTVGRIVNVRGEAGRGGNAAATKVTRLSSIRYRAYAGPVKATCSCIMISTVEVDVYGSI